MLKRMSIAFLICLTAVVCSSRPSPDPASAATPHATSVKVDEDVALEVLDWGGAGPVVVLLAGSGNSAHVFDDFAPKLTDYCHVYGITRRGHGVSSRPASGYHDQRLADDVFEVIEQLHLDHPVLVGHSAAGGEMTTLGRQHSDRLGGLVYMDALGDLEDDPPADAEWLALQQKLPAGLNPTPTCDALDRSTFEAFRVSWGCRLGFVFPISELRGMFEDADGHVGNARMPDWVMKAMGQGQAFRHDYSNIRVPVLAFMNFAPTTEALLAETHYQPKDNWEREVIGRFVARTRVVFGRWTDKLMLHVPDARIVNLGHVGHFLFMTREAAVLREIHGFMTAVDERKE